jgi:hypothetical protein
MVHIVAVADLAGTAMATAIMCNHAKAVAKEE